MSRTRYMTVRGKPEILPGPNRQRNIARGETAYYDFLKNAFSEIHKNVNLISWSNTNLGFGLDNFLHFRPWQANLKVAHRNFLRSANLVYVLCMICEQTDFLFSRPLSNCVDMETYSFCVALIRFSPILRSIGQFRLLDE